MITSIASYAFHGLLKLHQMDVFGYLETCKYRYHLSTADIWNGFLPTADADYIKTVRQGLDERGLSLENLCVDGAHIWEDDPDAREHNHQQALAWLQAAVILGAKTVRIDAGSRNETFTTEQFDHVIMRYKEYTKFAGDNGFRVGPENHWGPERVLATMQSICKTVDSPSFGMLLHFTNWVGADADRGDELIAPYVMHTHIAWHVSEGPLAEKLDLLRKVNYRGAYSIEHHTGKNEYSEVAVQLAHVQDVLSRW
ncbi:MAG: sugar phosphate isomerase/epimerase family protein [Anaerolineae bacterium]